MTLSWNWIDNAHSLDEVCRYLADCDVLGVDTEFLRETTFAPIPALIQLSDGQSAWLIDPLAVTPTPALRRLLGRAGPLKLLHACSEDLEIFQLWLGDLPTPMIDTQLAEGFCTGEAGIGYKRLVAQRLQCELPKDATRSDWTQRPLTDGQCRYAALDVQYLPAIWQQQRAWLDATGRLSWVAESCQALIEAAEQPCHHESYYLRHRQAWRLDARRLAALADLCAWREHEIRLRNIPRGHLANDGVLFSIAERMPKNIYALADIKGLRPSFIKKEGECVIKMIQEAQTLPDAALPAVLPSPQGAAWKEAFKRLRTEFNALAAAQSIAPELLMRRREREAWLATWVGGGCPEPPQDWRAELVTPFWATVFPPPLVATTGHEDSTGQSRNSTDA